MSPPATVTGTNKKNTAILTDVSLTSPNDSTSEWLPAWPVILVSQEVFGWRLLPTFQPGRALLILREVCAIYLVGVLF